jgi:hypothetical protein
VYAWLQNLISGAVGAIAGALIAGWYARKGSVEGARLAADRAEELFKEERRLQEAERNSEICRTFLSEMKLNSDVVGKKLGVCYATLLSDAWALALGGIEALDPGIRRKLVETYALIHRYNDAAEKFDPDKDPQQPFEEQAERLESLIRESTGLLEQGNCGQPSAAKSG